MSNQASESFPSISLPSWVSSEKCIAILTCVCFGLLSLLSVFIFAPVAATVNDVEGNCLLFSSTKAFGDPSVCNFCIAVPVIFMLLCGTRLVISVINLTKCSQAIPEKVSLWININGVHFFILILDILLAVLLLVMASLLSAGLSYMCDDLFGGRSECAEVSRVTFKNGDVSSPFYGALSFAEGSAWFTFCFWILVVCLETVLSLKSGTFAKIPCRA